MYVLIPGTYLMGEFWNLTTIRTSGLAMFNSFRNNTIIITILTLLICSITKDTDLRNLHNQRKGLTDEHSFCLAMMLPFVALMIPLFTIFSKMGLVNSWMALVLPSISTPFMIMLFTHDIQVFPQWILLKPTGWKE